MRILYVVQRYGSEALGGAEAMTRALAIGLTGRGHDVHVASSTASSYLGWEPVHPEGVEVLDGVTVHRFNARPHDDSLWDRVVARPGQRPRYLQLEWLRRLGPDMPALGPWLTAETPGFDICSPITYLFASTWMAGHRSRCPVVFHPTAHDEAALTVPLFQELFLHASGMVFLTEEERQLVTERFHLSAASIVTGLGVGAPVVADPDAVRGQLQIGDADYVICVGRFDPGKGTHELIDYFAQYKRRRPGPLKLVMVGDPAIRVQSHPDIICTGVLPIPARNAAMAGARALIQPSFMESFSLVLVEAWQLGVAALVQGRCAVLDGQVRRAGGGVSYSGYAEFEAALDVLLEDRELASRLGAAGARYVAENYRPETVLDRYEDFLVSVLGRRQADSPAGAS